jgi:hypothetical protein
MHLPRPKGVPIMVIGAELVAGDQRGIQQNVDS